MKTERKPTTLDVAARAGVSQSAVSMILNHQKKVSFSPDTIQRVLDSAEALGYQLRPHAGKSAYKFIKDTILVFCPVLSNPYYSALVQAIEQEAVSKDMTTLVCTTYRNIQKEQEYLAIFGSSNISGIIFTFIPQSCELVEQISQRIPVVVIGDRNTAVKVDTVEIDSISSGTLIANHLLELGHRHIAFISTTLSEQTAVRTKRLEGLQLTFQQECPTGTVLVRSVNVTSAMDLSNPLIEQDVGYRLAKECLEDKKITAFAAVNDMVAYGVMKAVQESGLSIPKDYSVCGFDNIFPSQFSSVSLTTVEHHITEKGHNAVNILHNRIHSDAICSPSITRVEYRPQLIVRNSTSQARTHDI